VFYFIPIKWDQHVRRWIFFGVIKKGQGFQNVKLIISSLGVLAVEELQKITQAELLGRNVEVHEIPLRTAACDSADLHARDVTRIGDCNFQELNGGEQYGVYIPEEAHLSSLNRSVQRVWLLRDQEKPAESLDVLEQGFLVKKISREEIQVLGEPVAEAKRKPGSAGKVKVVKQFRVA
jgi:hypothetical protein